jgi:hypothetical protein
MLQKYLNGGSGCARVTPGGGKVADLMRQDNVLDELVEHERFPWDRQPGESAKAFDAFVRFRDMGPRRMLRDVALGLHCSGANVRRWAARWFWHNRVAAFEEHLDRQTQEELRRGRIEMAERQIKAGIAAQDLAEHGLVELNERLKNGQQLRLKPNEIARLLQVGAEMERIARGEGAHAAPAPVQVIVYPMAADDEPQDVTAVTLNE